MSSDERDKIDLENLSKMVGMLVIQWGSAEQTLELTLGVLFDAPGRPAAKKIPQNLVSKLEYLTQCAAFMPSLAPLRTQIKKLVSDFERLSELRHNLIHGAASSINHIDGVYEFVKIDQVKGAQQHRCILLDARDFPMHMNSFIQLGQDAYALAAPVFEKFGPRSKKA